MRHAKRLKNANGCKLSTPGSAKVGSNSHMGYQAGHNTRRNKELLLMTDHGDPHKEPPPQRFLTHRALTAASRQEG